MPHNTEKIIHDLIQAIEDVRAFLTGVDCDTFLRNRLLQVGVERELEVMGEALNRLSRIDEERFYKIKDASKIVGMRNIIAHGYDIIDYRIIWHTATVDLPELYQDLKLIK